MSWLTVCFDPINITQLSIFEEVELNNKLKSVETNQFIILFLNI